jgi:hypothetical protein
MEASQEYSMIRDNIPIMSKDGIGLKYLRCGLCNLNNIKDFGAHAETEEHKTLSYKLHLLREVTDGHIDMRELINVAHKMTIGEIGAMFKLCLQAPKDGVEDQKRLNRRKVEKLLGER